MIRVPIFFQLNKLGLVGAQKELRKLTNQTKAFGLTSKLSIGAATVALTAYAKKSVAAALADEKAQKSLTQTLKNLGLAYTTVGVTNYIDSLQRATGVSEDQLRPAFQRLVLVIGNVGKAQSALALAMDISAGTGKDLNAVTLALSKGYSGQTTALSRLGVGLDKTLLKSGDMEAITAQLSKLFAGQAQAAVKTYSGQLAILSISAQEASETIGFALVDSLAKLSGDDGVKGLALQMEALALVNADVLVGFTDILAKFKLMKNAKPSKGSPLDLIPIIGPSLTNILRGRGERIRAAKIGKSEANPFDRGLTNRALDIATKLVAKKKESINLDKVATASKKLSDMFDMDLAQITAALKGKITDEERARLKGMLALKTEDKNDDISAVEQINQAKISAAVADRERKMSALQDTISNNRLALADVENTMNKIGKLPVPVISYAGGLFAGTSLAPTGTNASGGITPMSMPSTNAAAFGGLDVRGAAETELLSGSVTPTQLVVNVNPTGTGWIGNQDDFLRTVQMALQIGGRNGYSTSGLATG